MQSALLFILGLLLIGVITSLYVFKTPAKAIAYFKTPDGRKVFNGIASFVIFGMALTLLSIVVHADYPDKGEYFAYGEVFVGIDHPLEQSPQCVAVGPNKHITSNGGVRVNIYQSGDKRFALNSKYTHHSCAFNVDKSNYDAIGVELTYKLW